MTIRIRRSAGAPVVLGVEDAAAATRVEEPPAVAASARTVRAAPPARRRESTPSAPKPRRAPERKPKPVKGLPPTSKPGSKAKTQARTQDGTGARGDAKARPKADAKAPAKGKADVKATSKPTPKPKPGTTPKPAANASSQDRAPAPKRSRKTRKADQPDLFAAAVSATGAAEPPPVPRSAPSAGAVRQAQPTLLPEPEPRAASAPRRRATAESMATKQRDISVSEFFMKNRHLLGFDSPARALLTTVKEAFDNSLDACEEAGILPTVRVELVEITEDRHRVVIEDNGPGIVKAQVPKVFGKLLYGSKFHRLRQSVTADQPILVERAARVLRLPIGELVDSLLLPGELERDVGPLGLRVPAFDPSTWRYAWRPVSHVIRHERANEILEVRTEQGRHVRVTGCHSLFTYDPETRRVCEVEARALRSGDHVVAPRRIPDPHATHGLGAQHVGWQGPVGLPKEPAVSRITPELRFNAGALGLLDIDTDLDGSDLCLLRVHSVRRVDAAHPYVYDLAVPGCENFVAGEGLLACHNSRGQQGIGISAAGMYGQLTTGKPIVITSKTGKGRPAHHFEIVIDTARNAPNVVRDEPIEWERDHGTRVEIELQGTYKAGRRSVDEYIEQASIANPHAEIFYQPPKGRPPLHIPRVTQELPREPLEIQPHPYGVELGMLQKILQDSEARTLSAALQHEFSRVTPKVAEEIVRLAGLAPRAKPGGLKPAEVERLHHVIPKVRIYAPPTACVVPIGEELIRKGLEREIEAEFYTSATRPPAVYRGNPFQVEAGLAYGGELRGGLGADEESVHTTAKQVDAQEGPITLLRLANRVPLQYQQSSCAVFKSVVDTNWRGYGLTQPRGSLPQGPMVLLVHIASVWVPFTSESKEAVAHYPEILREMQLALQECGRRLGSYLRRRDAERHELRRRSIFEMYIGELVESLGKLTQADRQKLQKDLQVLARKHTGDGNEDVEAMIAPTKKVAKRAGELDEDEEAAAGSDAAEAAGAPATRPRKPKPKSEIRPKAGGGGKKKRAAASRQLELLDDEEVS